MLFKFKQFTTDQANCAMKVNTDGVLLGALATCKGEGPVLDIGTGTGVIALMLAQRYPHVQVNAVELDIAAAKTAAKNFQQSPFAGRLTMYAQSFQNYFTENPAKKYGLIVSNPPFYIYSLHSPLAGKNLARHADHQFFEQLISSCARHLLPNGALWLVLPLQTSALVKNLAKTYHLCIQQIIFLQSYPQSAPHREVLVLGLHQTEIEEQRLIIYSEPGIYTDDYRVLLKNFLTIF